MSRLVSVNAGLPREVEWKSRVVTTAIFKEPVDGPVRLRRLNLAGDLQADLRVHGGPDKAVYAYPVEHYSFWREKLGHDLPFGMFGENLTTAGMPAEDQIAIGDRYRVGTAELVVTQPRLPCFKLGIRFGDPRMVKRFLEAGRTGFYLRVEREGDVAAGDEIALLDRDSAGVPVSEVTRLFAHDRDDADGLRRVLTASSLPADWRDFFAQALEAAA